MRLTRIDRTGRRKGTVLPMVAVCLIGLCAFTALAVDLGMLAVSRTECQNAADAGALAGCRTLNNNSTTQYNNLPNAVSAVYSTVESNYDMAAYYTSSSVTEVDAGQYLYNTSTQTFSVYNGSGAAGWLNVTGGSSVTPSSGSWTAIQVTVSYTQPMYFLTVLGINSMPTGAVAAAVFRPRDTSFVLDMTGSMAYASQFNYNATNGYNGGSSNNPDTLVPRFGHYYTTRSNLIQNTNQYTSDGQAISQNNYCIYTPGGPPIIRDFVYDPTNVSNPSQSAYPITSNTSTLLNAFHRWAAVASPATNPPESGASSINYLGPVYDFTGYNAFDTTNTSGPTPAPDSFIDQFDATGIPYVGDRYPRLDGKVWTTPTSSATNSAGYPYPLTNPTPAWNDSTSGAALNDHSYLGISSVPSTPSGSTPTTYNSSWTNFRDPAWETYGYDLMMGPSSNTSPNSTTWPSYVSTSATYKTYRQMRNTLDGNTNGTPVNPANVPSTMLFASLSGSTWSGSSSYRFKGYSMGPGYWGKTFFIWPPDPRYNTSANVSSPNTTYPAFDTSGNAMCDWRRHFFLNSSGAAFNPQTTNINSVLFSSSYGSNGSSVMKGSGFQVNYSAVLAWLKSGPQVLPPNLRAGRIVFYSSIPNSVSTSGLSGQALNDAVFWKNYIDYVLQVNTYNNANDGGYSTDYLYGLPDNWSSATVTINQSSPSTIKYSWDTSASAPYMNYNDSPIRPRLDFWFGPLSMVDFCTGVATYANWLPGTVHEAQCWQLKVAMNSVISDVQNNHPNDTLGMVMFSASANNGPRVGQGQNYTALQNALFYPNSLLYNITYNANVTTEECPYSIVSSSNYTIGNALVANEIPNAQGSTDPDTGLAYAFNMLSASNQLTSWSSTTGPFSASSTSPIYGSARRGAAKMVILETDGVPNTYRSTSSSTAGFIPTKLGYDTYYTTSSYCTPQLTDGNTTVMQYAYNVVEQMTTQMATSGQTAGSTANSGLSLPNAPCLVYPIAFGDLFDATLAPNATIRTTALQFLAIVAYHGNTGTSSATSLPSGQIITGDYTTRISLLQTCLQNIFQSGVTVALIE